MAADAPEQIVRDGATREEIAEAFTNLVAHARRQQSIVEKYTTDVPTAWTKAHQHIDALLWDWQAAE